MLPQQMSFLTTFLSMRQPASCSSLNKPRRCVASQLGVDPEIVVSHDICLLPPLPLCQSLR